MRRGRGLGANDLILFNTASCINTYFKAAKKPGVKNDFGSNITAVLCNCLASGQYRNWMRIPFTLRVLRGYDETRILCLGRAIAAETAGG